MPTGTISGIVVGLPNLVVLRDAASSATIVPITWGGCTGYYACREPVRPFINGAINDQMRVGFVQPYFGVHLRMFRAGAGGTAVVEYWTGSVWAVIAGVQDGTNGLTADGLVRWPIPANWPKVSIEGSEPLHWVRWRAEKAWTTPPAVLTVGVPVPGAQLTFRGAALWVTTTDAEARYASPPLSAGAYVVHFVAPGWQSFVYLVPVVGGQQTSINIGPLGP